MYNPINSPEKQEKLGILIKNPSLSDLSAPRVLDLRHFGAFFMSCLSGLFFVNQQKLGKVVKNPSFYQILAPKSLVSRHFGAFFVSCVYRLFSVLSPFPIIFPFPGTKQIKSENLKEHPKIGGNRAPRHCTERKVQPAVLGWANGVRLYLIALCEQLARKWRN